MSAALSNKAILRVGEQLIEALEKSDGHFYGEIRFEDGDRSKVPMMVGFKRFIDEFDMFFATSEETGSFKMLLLSILSLSRGDRIPETLQSLCNRMRRPKPGDRLVSKKNEPIQIGPYSFQTRQELRNRVRKVFHDAIEHPTDPLPSSDLAFMLALLKYHPRAADKYKDPLDIYVAPTSDSKHRSFFVKLTDGSSADFSYVRCVESVPSCDWLALADITDIIQNILRLFPSVHSLAVETLRVNVTPIWNDMSNIDAYFRCLLNLATRLPSIRLSLLKIVFSLLVDLDLSIREPHASPFSDPSQSIDDLTVESPVFLKWKKEHVEAIRIGVANHSLDPNEAMSLLAMDDHVLLQKLKSKRSEEEYDDMSRKLDYLLTSFAEHLGMLFSSDFTPALATLLLSRMDSSAVSSIVRATVNPSGAVPENRHTNALLDDLFLIFQDMILPHSFRGLKRVHFFFFFLASRAPWICERFLMLLFDASCSTSLSSHQQQLLQSSCTANASGEGESSTTLSLHQNTLFRSIAIHIIGSFFARAAFLPVSVIQLGVKELAMILTEMREEISSLVQRQDTDSSQTKRRGKNLCPVSSSSAMSNGEMESHQRQQILDSSCFDGNQLFIYTSLLHSLSLLLSFCLPYMVKEMGENDFTQFFFSLHLDEHLLFNEGLPLTLVREDIRVELLSSCSRLKSLRPFVAKALTALKAPNLPQCTIYDLFGSAVANFNNALPLDYQFALRSTSKYVAHNRIYRSWTQSQALWNQLELPCALKLMHMTEEKVSAVLSQEESSPEKMIIDEDLEPSPLPTLEQSQSLPEKAVESSQAVLDTPNCSVPVPVVETKSDEGVSVAKHTSPKLPPVESKASAPKREKTSVRASSPAVLSAPPPPAEARSASPMKQTTASTAPPALPSVASEAINKKILAPEASTVPAPEEPVVRREVSARKVTLKETLDARAATAEKNKVTLQPKPTQPTPQNTNKPSSTTGNKKRRISEVYRKSRHQDTVKELLTSESEEDDLILNIKKSSPKYILSSPSLIPSEIDSLFSFLLDKNNEDNHSSSLAAVDSCVSDFEDDFFLQADSAPTHTAPSVEQTQKESNNGKLNSPANAGTNDGWMFFSMADDNVENVTLRWDNNMTFDNEECDLETQMILQRSRPFSNPRGSFRNSSKNQKRRR